MTMKQAARDARRSAVSLLLCLAVGFSGMWMAASPAAAEEGEAALLKNLVINKVYTLYQNGNEETPGFDPSVTDYTGTAYYSVNQINVFAFTPAGVTAQINGRPLENDRLTVDLAMGVNTITVTTAGNGMTPMTYTVTIQKVDYDYRGRRPIPATMVTATTEFGNAEDLPKMFDDDLTTYWSPTEVPQNEAVPGDGTGTTFLVNLGGVYDISRIVIMNSPTMWSSNCRTFVYVTSDETITNDTVWENPISNGNLAMGQGSTRYELGVSYPTRWIKVELAKWNSDQNLKIHQFQVFEDPADYPEPLEPDPSMSTPYENEARHSDIAPGQATVIERGIPIAGWMPSAGYGRGVPTAKESEEFGWDGPLLYDPPFQNPDFMNYNPDALWGIAKAPFGGNGMGSAGEPRDFIDESMKPYIRNAISFCFGDEGGYSQAEVQRFAKWFAWTKENYPSVIVHSNQSPGQWSKANLQAYMRIAEPDMISWDQYYNYTNAMNASAQMLNSVNWKNYRELALQGIDGTGEKPILFGMYLDAFKNDQPVSTKNLIANLAMLSGMKWLNFFRIEFQFDRCYLWDEDGTPTRGLFEWGDVLHSIKNIDEQLTRLTNNWIMTKPGEGSSAASGWHMGNFNAAESAAKNEEFLISDVNAVNVGGAQGGKRGDVLLGYFNALPGLSAAELAENFSGSTAPKGFMLLNGLVAGSSGLWNNPNVAGKEPGSADNTRQEITVTVSGQADRPTLYHVDKETGAISEVVIGMDNTFRVSLGGGEAELYFWGFGSESSTVTVNDNAMGTGINRFSYDNKWSYRENENNQGLAGLENKDIHFSVFENAASTLTFYGTKVELRFRNNTNTSRFQLSLDGGDPVEFATTGRGGATISKIFDNLELGVHQLSVVSLGSYGAIDCAVVTYTGVLPGDDPYAVLQTYVNQTAVGTGRNQFEFDPVPTVTTNRAPTGEENGWIQHKQTYATNTGWTGTSQTGASYTLRFYGTGATLFAGLYPFNIVGVEQGTYGEISMILDDGEETPVILENVELGGSGNNPIAVFHVDAPNANYNAEHTLKIITKSGNNRIDYAVVNRLVTDEKPAPINVALNKPVTTDSEQADNPAKNANDGKNSTRWCAAGGSTAGHWLQIDLGESQRLAKTEILWEKDNAYQYTIEVSDDGENWTTAVDQTARTEASAKTTDSMEAAARYVKLTITGGLSSGVWASLYEFAVFADVS